KDGPLLLRATGVRDTIQISGLVGNETPSLPCVSGSGKAIGHVLRPTTGACDAGGRPRSQAENQAAVVSRSAVWNSSVRVAVENPIQADGQPFGRSSPI